MLSEMSNEELLALGDRAQAGENIFIEAIESTPWVMKGSIMKLVSLHLYPHSPTPYVYGYGHQHRHQYDVAINLKKVALAPLATKTFTPKKVTTSIELEAPQIFDGLGQEVNIGDILALKDQGHLLFVRYESYKGINTLMFRDVRKGENVKRMPGGLDQTHRTYTFDHSVKISDKPTLDLLMINKLSA